ncbi:Appr-1-p processing protein [Verrucomicrobiaceae bacterium SCGC AG-212-N21]|nr:Appr-1-p processing protein [Verrucomicrobiaceae bacterium SCGC AG-212-N21]
MKANLAIEYVVGDATQPAGAGPAIIAHVCNDVGGWGAGFVVAISKRWKTPEAEYRRWHRGDLLEAPPFVLGQVQFVRAAENVVVANMIGQHGTRWQGDVPPIRYDAVDAALARVGEEALRTGASVHMPRIGCGLAGGSWDRIEPLIEKHLTSRSVAVTVYDFRPAS